MSLTEEAAAARISASEAMLLLDWKRCVSDLYHEVRAAPEPQNAWRAWRTRRDQLFADHARSPVPRHRRPQLVGLAYFDYDPAARALGEVRDTEVQHFEMQMSDGGSYPASRFAVASFELYGLRHELDLYWLGGFRGGLFLPFRDATNGESTYGGGRYLLDTLKGEDLGIQDGFLVLDFNFAYHPPCFFNEDWSCPLAPPANHLSIAIHAGERTAI